MRKRGGGLTVWLAPALAFSVLLVVFALLQTFMGEPASVLPVHAGSRTATGAESSGASVPRRSEGWQTVFSETFENGIGPGWVVTDTSVADGGEYTWGARSFEPVSPITAAWCVGGGDDGVSLTAGLDDYPHHADTWLIYGPVELGDAWGAYARFKWWMEGGGDSQLARRDGVASIRRLERSADAPDQGDWLGWCVFADATDLESALSEASCTYVTSAAGAWMLGSIPLDAYLPATRGLTNTVWIGFHFLSDGDGRAGRGAFIDDVELRVNRGYRVFMPLVRKPPPGPARANLLTNGGFEELDTFHRALVLPADGEPREENQSGIFTPPYWLTWYYQDPGTWDQPQVLGLADAPDDVKERRVWQGENGTVLFTSYRRHDAGFLQQVDVEPGTRLRLEAWAHAWSNNGGGPPGLEEHPGWSEGAGFDCFYAAEGDEGLSGGVENIALSVGIDPTGGVDPDADTVRWGTAAHVYNCYRQVPAVEVEAQRRKVTIFLRSRVQWPFWHNHAYWDDVRLIDVDGGEARAWPYPVVAEGSRLGVHGILRSPVLDYVDGAAAGDVSYAVVKAVDNVGWLSEVKEAHPETITVARLTSPIEGCPRVGEPSTDLDEMANALMSYILNEISLDPSLRRTVDYWEVINEPDPPEAQGYPRLAELMIKCMERAEMNGLKLALFSFNYGTPEWFEMEGMVETGVFARAREGGHILATHEGVPGPGDPIDLWWGQTIPGAPEVPGAGLLCFRYRFLYHLLQQRDEVIPLFISEWYADQYQVEGGTPQDVVAAVRWYDELASEDYWMLGLCPFTVGPTSEWRNKGVDYTFAYPALVDYMREVRDRENALPPGYPAAEGRAPYGDWR
jgi:hypothetical protein